MILFEREVSPRTAAWAIILGGCAFVLIIVALAAAYVWLGVPVNGETGMPPSRDLTILFALSLLISDLLNVP
jgi:hypothetical protein